MLQKNNRDKILKIFFDNPIPKGIGFQLREISRISKIAPPSVKKYLKELDENKLIIQKKHRTQNYPIYYANQDYEYFRFLKKINTLKEIKESSLLDYLNDNLMPNLIILFGSASKGEDLEDSDIDLFIECNDKKLDLSKFETKLYRKINLFLSKDFNKLSKELKNNLINGIILKGYLKVY